MGSGAKKRMEDPLASVVYRPGGRDTLVHFSGAVLTGGRSRRMGSPKSRLIVGGETLLHRQLRILREAGASELWISVNPESPESPPEDPPTRIASDRIMNAGPLAGMEALLLSAQTPWVLIVAVDLPRLTVGFIKDLLCQVTETSGAVPILGGRVEPLCAVYPKKAAAIATRCLEEGRLEATRLAHIGIQEGWLTPWTLSESDGEHLTNWNHPGEFEQGGPAMNP